jgi:hypothetical protein
VEKMGKQRLKWRSNWTIYDSHKNGRAANLWVEMEEVSLREGDGMESGKDAETKETKGKDRNHGIESDDEE